MTRLRLAVVGVGHLGKEHARILSGLPDVDLVGVVDPNPAQAQMVAERCRTTAYSDYRELFGKVDGVVVAAPTARHHEIAGAFLDRGVSLLVEKPLASSLGQADDLVARAGRGAAALQVGHIERFNPAYEELRKRSLRPRYMHCERYSGFSGRSTDVGVVFDLMVHDLDLVLDMAGSPLERVEALGAPVLGGHEDVAQARLTFADGCVADLSASRVHPSPVRRMQVWAADGFAHVDFAQRKLTMARRSDELSASRLDSRRCGKDELASLKAELFSRHLVLDEIDCAGGDQLTAELQHFVDCVTQRLRPRVDGVAGRNAVAAATRVLDCLNARIWPVAAGRAAAA